MEVSSKSLSVRTDKRENVYLIWSLFFLVMLYMTARCATAEALDLHRYYDDAFSTINMPIGAIIEQESSRAIDFIYFVILHYAIKLSIPLNLVTALIVTMSYALITRCYKHYYVGKIEWFVIATMMFLTPITWIIEISRNMTAFMFLYASLHFGYKKKWIWSVAFCLMGLYTHFSVLMFVVLFALCFALRFISVKKQLILVIIFIIFLSSYLVPSYISDIISLVVGGSDTVYNSQYAGEEALGFSNWDFLGKGDKLPILYGLLYSVALLLVNKKQGVEFWMLMGLTVLLAFFVRTSIMFTNRCMMIMPMFWALNVAQIYASGIKRDKRIVRNLSLLGLLPIFWHIFSYRDVYFPFFF